MNSNDKRVVGDVTWRRSRRLHPFDRRLLFIETGDAKQVKNRATEVADLRNSDGSGWMVLADPEGNEFCILRSNAERARVST